MSFKINPLHALDSYKLGHPFQYPPGTTQVYSNTTARSDKRFGANPKYHDGKIVLFGVFGAWKDIVEIYDEEFFKKSKEEAVKNFANRIVPFIGTSKVETSHIEALHDLGYLPLRLKTLPEGSRVNMRIPLFTITNTHPAFYWLVNGVETWLQNETWKPMTTATIAYTFRKILEDFAEQTGSPKDFIPWQGHDFSCRGMSNMLDSAKSGSGHLTSFTGSDTVSAVDYIEWAYRGKEGFVAGSIPATEHAVTTMNGPEGELAFVKRLITEIYPDGPVSCVADSYDFWSLITDGAKELKSVITARGEGKEGLHKVVFRPDSGDPVDILCGTAVQKSYVIHDGMDAPTFSPGGSLYVRDATGNFFKAEAPTGKMKYRKITPTPEMKGAVECLWDIFGGTMTSKDYKLLDSHVGLIYGDSITLNRAEEILSRLTAKGFASANVVFGIGSYTYNCLTRDVFGIAMKATYGVVDGVGREIFKAPKTDDGTKHSAKGLLMVEKIGNDFVLVDCATPQQEASGELRTMFEDGKFLIEPSIFEIRERLWPTK